MTTTRRTKITFEKHELTLISLPPDAKFFCRACDAELEHLTVACDVGSLVVSDRSDLRPEKSELINSTEKAEGKLLICAHSENLFGEKSKTEER